MPPVPSPDALFLPDWSCATTMPVSFDGSGDVCASTPSGETLGDLAEPILRVSESSNGRSESKKDRHSTAVAAPTHSVNTPDGECEYGAVGYSSTLGGETRDDRPPFPPSLPFSRAHAGWLGRAAFLLSCATQLSRLSSHRDSSSSPLVTPPSSLRAAPSVSGKTIGLLGSVALTINNVSGPGMLQISKLFQEVRPARFAPRAAGARRARFCHGCGGVGQTRTPPSLRRRRLAIAPPYCLSHKHARGLSRSLSRGGLGSRRVAPDAPRRAALAPRPSRLSALGARRSALDREAGWLVPLLAFGFVCAVSSFAVTLLSDTIARLPGNDANFTKRVEFSDPFQVGRLTHH